MVKEETFAFFLGCIMPNRYPQIEKATKFVMERLGYKILEMEKAACCPAPGVFRSFNKADWMVHAARNIAIAEKMDADILTVCNGCFGTLQEVNKRIKEDETLRLKVNEKLKLLGDYKVNGTITVRHIAEVLGYDIGPWGIEDKIIRKINARVAVHYGCHFLKPTKIREIDSSEKPTIIEEFIEALGVKSIPFKEQLTCCGAGGGVKAYDGNASMTIFSEKMVNIDEVKPDFILDICPFCHLQFETGQDYLNQNQSCNYDYPVIHLSQLTAYCMGMDQEFIGLQYQKMGRDFLFGEKSTEEGV
ncbi:MAG: CoB--CoM heterodisulfide reductase subunit B [Candidatus Lokiarchaeota archaeon]|nr:CoB--CoM heterodisulfide reductase subunit B [Candidatus Lokiarchaeota archaeon]MBD3201512.1 CoB--CoM heterodisulfide reductase subunit B [Candidatus Lokiarchaeota archaeon]